MKRLFIIFWTFVICGFFIFIAKGSNLRQPWDATPNSKQDEVTANKTGKHKRCVRLSMGTHDTVSETYMYIYDMVTENSFWYNTSCDQRDHQSKWSPCIDLFRYYVVWVFELNGRTLCATDAASSYNNGTNSPTDLMFYPCNRSAMMGKNAAPSDNNRYFTSE